ncbi:MAG: hypothetical protein GXP26_10065 [Planctomycetes bacterium]|nr:hypothetical protein [Planctomycetota bacterium]
MLRLPRLQLLLAAAIALAVQGEAVHAQLEQLANRIPETANALVVIRAKDAYASPFARAQSWDQQQGQHAHRDGMIDLPAGADNLLMAAELDFEFMQPLWEVAVAHVRQMPTMKEVAARCGGRLDRLAGAQAVERPNDSFVVALGPKVIGAMSPANRQQVIRWVRKSRSRKKPALSPYLTDTLRIADDHANHIVMALDLHDILAPAEVTSELAKEKSLLGKAADLGAISKVIASIRGIRLEVELQNPPQGHLSLDFNQDAAILDKLAKPLLLNILAKYGAGIDEIKGWKVQSKGKSITLQGELSQSGLRRVLSLLSGPVGPMASVATPEGASTSDTIAEASQRYFQSVTNYLNDLFASNFRPQSLYQAKVWINRYARKIDDLDDHQVDEEVVAFGLDVVDALNEIVSILDRSEMRSDLREANLYESGRRRYARYGAYDYVEKSYVARDRQLVQADEASRGLQDTQVIVDDLRRLSAEIRKIMTKRYDRQF